MDTLYMARAGVQYGPFPEAKARELIAQRRLVGTDLVWFAGMQTWQPAAEALSGWFPAAAPTPPPLPALTPPPIPQQTSATPPAPPNSANAAVPSPAAPSAKPWTKPLESLKGVVGADKLIDPQTLPDTLTQMFRSAENSQSAEQTHGDDQDHDDTEDQDEHDDPHDDWNTHR